MAKKRAHGEGAITKRKDGRYMGQLTVEYDHVTGTRKRKTVYGKTKKEVSEKIHQAKVQLGNGTFVMPNKVTVGQCLREWLEDKKNSVRQSTWENYEIVVNAHLIPAFDNILLKDLTSEHLKKFYNEKLESGRRDGKGGLSARSVNYMHTIMYMVLETAVEQKKVQSNVAKSKQLNRPKEDNKKCSTLNIEQMNEFLSSVSGHRLFPAFLVEWGTGLRRGELLGLKWQDIDLEKGTLLVNRSLTILKKGLVFTDPKTKTSRRTIPLPKEAVIELAKWRDKQAQEKAEAGRSYEDNDLVFCHPNGKPINPTEFTKLFKRQLKKAGLPEVRFHDLRHSHASMLIALQEQPKVIQERLGHKTITMTFDTYGHLFAGLQEKASAKLSATLKIKKEPSQKEG